MDSRTITEVIKAKVFAQYIGCPVIPFIQKETFHPFDLNEGGLHLSGVLGTIPIIRRIAEDVKDAQSQCALLVTHISNIHEKHAAVIGEILGFTISLAHNGNAFCRQINNEVAMSFNFHPIKVLECFDFLRSRNYALPYRNYSVDELISAKVFQLTK